MRFMMLMFPAKFYEAGDQIPDTKVFEEMNRYNEELQKAGVLLALDGLHPASKGARVRVKDGKKQVVDGPFTEAKEIIGGYWVIQTRTREEAVEAAWVAVDPVIENHHPAFVYEPDSWGPIQADALIAADGGWRNPAPQRAPA